ncbi:hypothetical protein BBK82_45785 [Lentzea guizhouensis]|uniref:Uncharacterized protein n=1 Tax=Lentzea guizhouensis TaxID=1586287 RepID=A0A1B2HWQ5_9PSEU|nr:hypothetical protein [Lentzea guizhouensis]ANZ42166.1 hypothetical protein BBK82_45785 [Lentzea guizhouensis]
MTIDLPPRRALPVEVKERMRPAFTGAPRRNHTPLAVAAGVALLIAGGVAVTQTTSDSADPAHDRVTAPSELDLARCRAALGDGGWRSTEMVVFDSRKVLIGADSRFCELTRSRAHVVNPAVAPVRLEAGTVAYVSDNFIAGIPPLGALSTRARESTSSYSRGSKDSVTTPDFFVAYFPSKLAITQLVFDDRFVPLPPDATPPRSSGTDSFESGDSDPATLDNRLARCLDGAAATAPLATAPGWRPVVAAGFDDGPTGVVVARQDGHPDRYGVCHGSSDTGFGTFTVNTTSERPRLTGVLNISGGAGRQLIAGYAHPNGRFIEIDALGVPRVTVPVVDGFFAAELSGSLTRIDADTGNLVTGVLMGVVRDADNSVIYTGSLT